MKVGFAILAIILCVTAALSSTSLLMSQHEYHVLAGILAVGLSGYIAAKSACVIADTFDIN